MEVGFDQTVPGISGFPHRRDGLALTDPVPHPDIDRLQMSIQAAQMLGMFKLHESAQSPMDADLNDDAASNRSNRAAERCFQIDTAMAPVAAARSAKPAIPFGVRSNHERVLIKRGYKGAPIQIEEGVCAPSKCCPCHHA